MCSLYGCLSYGKPLSNSDLTELVKQLGIAAMVRGVDATGIAYAHKNRLHTIKAARPADEFVFELPERIMAVMGHTRLTTQGSEMNNYNNHPFFGYAGADVFVLAHNGMIDNDAQLRQEFGLAMSKIQTDSYVAVQLLEKQGRLDINVIKLRVSRRRGKKRME